MSMISATRRSFLAGVGAAGLFAAAGATSAKAESASDASLASLWQGMELIDADDNEFLIKDGRKPLTMIKMWANWCPVCLNELGKLDAFVAAVGPQNLDVILISHPSWFQEDQQVARRRNVGYRLATPSRSNGSGRIDAALMDANGLYSVPRSLILRKADDEVMLAHRGAMDWTNESLLSQLRSAVA